MIKELRDAFATPLVYVVGALFSLLTGWLFYNYLLSSQEWTTTSIQQAVVTPLFGNMNFLLLFLAPLLTMRQFAEERKTGTLELLLLTDLGHAQIILAKFLSALMTVAFLLLLTVVFPIILHFSGHSNLPVLLSGYAGLFLCGAVYVAVGLFASTMTENQIVAAVLGLCLLLGQMMLVFTSNATENVLVAQMTQYLATPFHYEGMARGAIKSYSLLYFGSSIGFFLYLCHLKLASRDW
jgi:ABC-2 type transport system permease protein